MNKRSCLFFMVVFIAILLIASAANASIAPLSDLRASDYITDYYGDVESNSQGKLTVNFSIDANDVMTILGVKTIVLQERANVNAAWGTYGTYTYEDYSKMLKSKAASYINDITINVKSGYQYRAKMYFYAEKGGYDTRELITNYVKAK